MLEINAENFLYFTIPHYISTCAYRPHNEFFGKMIKFTYKHMCFYAG